MTTPGHDGEHGGAMDRIKSVWRDAVGPREDDHDGSAANGQAWGGQHAPPAGTAPYQGPTRVQRPAQSTGPVPQQSTPSRDGEHDGWQAPAQPTVAQAVPWQAPRPMQQPISPQQVTPLPLNPQPLTPQPLNARPLPQRPGPPPLPQRAVPQQPPQWTAPPQPPAPPATGPAGNAAEPPTTWQPAAVDEPTELAPPPVVPQAESEPATAGLTGPQSTAQAQAPAPEPDAPDEDVVDEEPAELDEPTGEEDEPIAEDSARPADVTVLQPVEPVRRPVWTEPEPARPQPANGADRVDTPDRPMPAYRPLPAAPDRFPSSIPSHITAATAGPWNRPQNGASTRPRGRHELFDAPNREADPMPDPQPVPGSPNRAPAAAAQLAAAPDAPSASPGRFVPEERAGDYADRWSAAKSEFVDEPREAVRKADALVGELLADISRALAEQRAQLDRGLDSNGTSTEDLRQAMHRYRQFFDRLLTL